LLQNFHRPKFFICGSRDDFVDLEELRRRVAELPEPKELEIVPGADHFWWGRVEELSTKVADFFAATLESRLP
ncbi:MAG: PhoPQ-activated protein PqaA family protein, partial [Candidatus Freyarchaeota archaeon]